MNSPAMFKLIKNAYLNGRYTLEHLKGFTRVGTISKAQFDDVTGFNYDDLMLEYTSKESEVVQALE